MSLTANGNVLNVRPCSLSGYKLLHDGVCALSEVEAAGMRIDEAYLDTSLQKLDQHSKKVTDKLRRTEVWDRWRKKYGSATKMTAKAQLADILFNVMGYPVTAKTDSGKPKADEEHISTVDIPFVRGYIKLSKINTLKNKLKGIKRETVDGILHPVYNLHIARTFRSSSDRPNFQNMPIRDPWMGKVIRRCFVPRPGRVIVEIDYSGIEVRVAACYHKDPVMIKYITDPASDMHRDMAAQIFMLDINQVEKAARHSAKNQFVFPQFYGDYYINNAKAMWGSIDKFGLKKADGQGLKEHLASKGVQKRGPCNGKDKAGPGTFEHHMKQVEDDFWNNRFAVYGQWKKDWMKDYQRAGGFETLTGFRLDGIMAKNDVINYPVQGSAFHCLLWSLIRVNRWLRRSKMNTQIVGQIHDSIVADVDIRELGDYLHNAQKIMCEDVKKYAPWLNVPLEVEAEITPREGTWYDKKDVEITDKGFNLDGELFEDASQLVDNI